MRVLQPEMRVLQPEILVLGQLEVLGDQQAPRKTILRIFFSWVLINRTFHKWHHT